MVNFYAFQYLEFLFETKYKSKKKTISSRGLSISDMPMHDANRDLMLMNEHWEEEWNLTQSLEILNDNLSKALSELESEKKKTDK